MGTINLSEAKCKKLTIEAPIVLATENEDGADFIIDAYTGAPVDRWWGKLAIDLNGIKSKQQMPNLMNHDSDKIVGYTLKAWTDKNFKVAGKFSKVTEEGKRALGLLDEGFPWQASIGVRASVIKSLSEKEEQEINGYKLSGPAEIWLESEVVEVSFVPLGADSNTSISRLSQFEEVEAPTGAKQKPQEDKKMELTLEVLEKDAPELLKQIQDAAMKCGADQERARIQAVLENSMPGHEKLTEELAFDGKTTGEQAAVQILKAEKLMIQQKKQDLKDDAVPPVPQPAAPEPKKQAKQPTTEEEFKANESLVEEFGDFQTYSAYLDAEKKGLIKTMGGRE